MLDNMFKSFNLKPKALREELEVVRVFVMKCNGLHQPESRKFSFDPRVTNNMVLRMLLVEAFKITDQDFAISYLSKDDKGEDVYLSLLTDLDLRLALQHSSLPVLRLKLDCSPFSTKTGCLDDWDIIQSSDVSYYRNSPYSPGALSPNRHSNRPDGFTGGGGGGTGVNGGDNGGVGTGGAASAETRSLLQNPIEETLSRMSRALNMGDKRDHGFRYLVPPLKDIDFRNYLDDEGSLIKPDELRLLVYQIGVEHSLRKVVWKHLLNVYPTKPRLLTGAERYDYMKVKCEEYYQLKKRWQNMDWENKKSVVSSIRKDVLRTDRSHAFFSDIEVDFEKTPTNPHLTSLFDILMTFAMSFPQISYCQGMSDLASPLLLIMQDEAVTYVCFCALMRRLQQNFTVDSRAMHIKFDHLKLLLQYVDKEFFDYLSSSSESNNFELFFCYRWLLLEMKREFALDDALLMLEVMWASIPPDPPESVIKLATDSILQFMKNQCNLSNTAAFTSPTGHNASATSSSQALDSSIVNRLNPLDASNQDLLNWSMEQNVKSEVPTSNSNSNFAHLSSKQPLNDIDQSISKCSSVSFDENVSSGKVTPREESQNVNLKSEALEMNGMLTPTKVRYPIATTKESNCNNIEQSHNAESTNSRVPKQSSLDQEASPVESYLHAQGQESLQSHKLNHASSCPSLDHSVDDPSETSDLGTTDSDNNQDDDGFQETPASLRMESHQPTSLYVTANGSAAYSTEIKALHRTYPMIQKSSALASSQSSSSLSPGGSELKRARSDLEVSPNGFKKRGSANVFSYEDSSSNAQISSLSSLTTNSSGAQTKTKLPPPAEFGCGNPFLLFMCVTLIVQQKQKIIGAQMDITDVSGYFYRLVRSHDVHKVLTHARMLFADYLRKQPWLDDSDC
ncbi:uncharacterized protein LOC142337663 isoform X3 [Convolutriloba macropyga]|uniref:uncharacterized protein LOC142337663 isoform X3 n=1 Tax=Convolutriloba macropyga TaxID=536237 RepID=UPI003F51CA68